MPMGGMPEDGEEDDAPDDDGDREDDFEDQEEDDEEEEEVPLPVEDEDDSGEVDIDDETLPLVSPDLVMGTKHCISHFLELILAGGVTAYGFGSTRKKKKEIDELKKGKRG